VTRGKRLVVLVGQRRAIAIAVRGTGMRRRWSRLATWLQEKVGLGAPQAQRELAASG
jgi:hypothetical protein